jgi:hypothetical protein
MITIGAQGDQLHLASINAPSGGRSMMLKNKSTLTHSTRISQKNTPNNPKALFGAATETVLRRIIWKMFSRLSAHCFLTFLIQRKFISVESSQFLLSKYVAPCCDI